MDAAHLKALVEEFLEKLGVETQSVEVTTGHRTRVIVRAEDPSLLIGPGGEHLRALNALIKRLAEVKYGSEAASFLVDVNDYHEEQLERVREQARTLAQRARLFKHDVDMPPLSAYERLVVHELFAEDPEIETQSAGEGKFRHIVLKYKSA